MTVKLRICLCTAILFMLTPPVALPAAELLVEAEQFDDLGGWLVDAQFMDVIGSSYLLAHGLGNPVANARTEQVFSEPGTYHVWVRSKDWVPSHHPGRFKILIKGSALPVTFGTHGEDWTWERAGTVEIDKGPVTIELTDLTGFDGRCDAIFFTTVPEARPPSQVGESMQAWRRRLQGHPDTPETTKEYDLVVAGGGVAGCSAALTASRLGLTVAFIQNRPVLGGNASSEIGITTRGHHAGLVKELVARGPNGAIQAESVLHAEKNVDLFLGWHVCGVEKDGKRILSVNARHITTGQELRFPADLFVDTTGVGALGHLAGAEYRIGREAADEFNEGLAPKQADNMHHGNTIIFRTRKAKTAQPFPAVPWALEVAKDYANLGGQIAAPGRDNLKGPSVQPHRHGDALTHYWEYGQWLDPIADAEKIRDHLFCAIYGTFANVKRHPNSETLVLDYVGHVPAGGESRRLMGDYILTENDIRTGGRFDDIVAINSGHFCLHYPGEAYDFRLGDWKWVAVKPFGVPFRCLYSRNVENLMMAGKHISVSHVAGSCTKTMLNGGQHGAAVGAAAYLCKKYDCPPRTVGRSHIKALRQIIFDNERLAQKTQERTALPKVLIIGDSISLGYTPHVRQLLKERAIVKHHKGNAGHTGMGLEKLDKWIGTTQWDIIHFNWGLWDLCYRHPDSKVQGNRDKVNGTITTPLEIYEKNLNQLVTRLKKTGAQLIWAHTTLVPEQEAGRFVGDDKKYNDAAAKVMKKHHIPINDLHALTKKFPPDLFVKPGDVHYTKPGYQKLANQVALKVLTTLEAKPAGSSGRK